MTKIWEDRLRVTWEMGKLNKDLGLHSIVLRVVADLLAADMQGDEGCIAGSSGRRDGKSLRLVALGKCNVIRSGRLRGQVSRARHATKIVSSRYGVYYMDFCVC